MVSKIKSFDAFICHASEDKSAFVRPLAEALTALGYRIWYDEFSITVGDGLRRAIDKGISNSRFGIVILSKAFFDKGWTNYELDGLLQYSLDEESDNIILPIWYKIHVSDVRAYSLSLANLYSITTNGDDVGEIIKELEKKIGEYYYTVDSHGLIHRSERKINIHISKREKRFQLIANHNFHRLFNKIQCVITSDTIIYPYSKNVNSLKFNHWQSNEGIFQLIRHVAYDLSDGQLISTKNEIIKNDGNNFISEVTFKRSSTEPVRVICEIKTTNLYKSLFEFGSDENEILHRIRIEHLSFSMHTPNTDEFAKLNVYVDGLKKVFTPIPGGKFLKHEIFGTETSRTVFAFNYEI